MGLTIRWERRHTAPLPSRSSHSATLIGEEMIIIGGESGESSGRCTNDVVALHLEKLTWRCLAQEGPAPCARLGHAACSVEGSAATLDGAEVWLFGGGDGKVLLRDLWALAPAACVWRSPKCNGARPAARIGHALAHLTLRDALISCGGFLKGVAGGYSMQVMLLELPSLTWANVQTRPAVGGVMPSGRLGAAICPTDGGRRVLLFGGSAFGTLLEETLSLDTDAMTFSQLELSSPAGKTFPLARANGVAVAAPPYVLHVGGHGGAEAEAPALDALDLQRRCWAVPTLEGKSLLPACRQKHSLVAARSVAADGTTEVKAYVWGGDEQGERSASDQILCLTIRTGQPQLPQLVRPAGSESSEGMTR